MLGWLRWIVPPLVALALYWPGLVTWFQKDDFAWLGLNAMIHEWADLMTVLFYPYAQGTVRTLSERVFFTGFHAIFGLNPLPFHVLLFVTHTVNLTLINSVCAKLTGSPAAGFWAAMLWTLNANMAFALAWIAIYYELLCATVFLLGLWLLIRYAETNERRYWIAQWAVYLAGFLVLELNVVYPALAAACAFCFARRLVPETLWMFAPALAYTALHFAIAPALPSGPYHMHWDMSVLPTLWIYWKTALGPVKLINLDIYPSLGRSALAVAMMIGPLGFLLWQACRRQWMAAFFAAWFVIVLAPLLPLRDHFSDYYLTVPLAGLAMWFAWGLVWAWRRGIAAKCAAGALLTMYVSVNAPLARVNVNSFRERGEKIRVMVEDVVKQRRLHPNERIVLREVDVDVFWSAIVFRPFRLWGIDGVYVSRDARAAIEASQPGQDIGEFFEPAEAQAAAGENTSRAR